jgi:hypothetical protein
MPATGLRRLTPLFAILFVLAAFPVSLIKILPLVDYPNHLARMYLLANLPSSPTLQAFYAIHWRPVPNLAMDAIVPTLSRVIPLEWAGKLFVLATFLLLAGGVAALHRVLFGRWTAWPFLAFLLLYNRVFLWGFLNYLFGIGLALCAFAAWIALRERNAAIRLVLGCVFCLATYFSHLMAYGVYGLLIVGYEVGLLWRRRATLAQCAAELAVAGLSFLPPLAILVFGSAGSVSGAISFGSPWRKLDMPFSVFDNYSRPFDIACFAVAFGGFALACRRGWIRLEPRMALPLSLLGIAFLVLPNQLFTAFGADHRLPVALALVMVAATSWVGPASAERRFLAAAGLLFLLRLGVVAASWHASDEEYTDVLAAFDNIPSGSRIAVAFPGAALHAGGTPMVHLPIWAVAQREAFVPTMAAFATQQPIDLQPPYKELAEALPPAKLWSAFIALGPPLDPAVQKALARYDFVVFVDARPFTLTHTIGLEPAYVGSSLEIYRVIHQPEGARSAKAPIF